MPEIKITEQLLEDLTGKLIRLMYRTDWPHQSEFEAGQSLSPAQNAQRAAHIKEQFLRDQKIKIHVGATADEWQTTAETYANGITKLDGAYSFQHLSRHETEPPSPPALEFRLLGAEILPQPNQGRQRAALTITVPDPRWCESRWIDNGGIVPERVVPVDLAVFVLHEAGHSLFTFDAKNNIAAAYADELYAETWGAGSYQRLGGKTQVIDSITHYRAVSGILTCDSSYWIAPGVEAWRNNKPQPAFEAVAGDIMELRFRTMLEAFKDQTPIVASYAALDSQTLRSNEVASQLPPHWIQALSLGQFLVRSQIKTPEHFFSCMAKVLTRKEIRNEEAMLNAAEQAIRGYEHFCPSAAKDAIHPQNRTYFDVGCSWLRKARASLSFRKTT